ncbi:MAG: transglycosylase SLT domain-containing protein [Candidatus Rokuibacteriota bacterium]
MLSRYREPLRAWTDPVGHALFRLRLRPNHLTVAGLGVSLLAAAAFVTGRTRTGGVLLLLAGLFDFFDGSLARASGQVTPFGAFLDSVIDRYSDIVVLLGIVVFFAQMPHARGAIVAMAGLVGSVMVSYTKARAESIGVECNVGVMERPERMICLIAGAVFGLLEPALWVLAALANATAIQRILFTRRAVRDSAVPTGALLLAGLLATGSAAAETAPPGAPPISAETERAWARAVADFQAGDAGPLVREFSGAVAQASPIADYLRFLLAEALARVGDLDAARGAARAAADRHPDSRLAPAALVLAATLASSGGDDTDAQAILKRLISTYPDAAEVPQALYLLGMTGEARGQPETAALVYRQLRVLAPATGWAEGASDRLEALAAAGVRVPELSASERLKRAERLLRDGVPKIASDEAERIAKDAREADVAVRALRVVADASAKLGRYAVAAKALELASARAPADQRLGLQLEEGRLWRRAGQRERALTLFAGVETSGAEAEAAEATYLRARTLDELDRVAPAVTAYKAVAARYPAREVAGASLWRLGWVEYLRGDLRGAAKTWLRILQIPGGRAWRLPALYWGGRATEQTTGAAAAASLYQRVLDEAPRSYYGLLAARRVSGPGDAVPEPAIRLPADPRDALADDPGFARAELLRRIGLVEFAVQELDDVVQRSVGDPVRLYGLSRAFVESERYHLALRILRPNFRGPAESGHATLPRAFWEMLYPFGWRDEINEIAAQTGLEAFLVAAVVREESSYHPRAVSRAGARGLMQLMPGTAQPMAAHRGLPFGNGDLLDDPRTNLQLGATFLAGLMREWGDPRLALAAYNAGPSRARQWWQSRRTNDLEAWVEQIPFDETRLYVKRVMLSWEEYRRIYGSR